MRTGWFPAGVAPAHDGCYIVRRPKTECWFFCRWCGVTGQWFSAGSTGTSQFDVIGWSSNAQTYEWRGLKESGK